MDDNEKFANINIDIINDKAVSRRAVGSVTAPMDYSPLSGDRKLSGSETIANRVFPYKERKINDLSD